MNRADETSQATWRMSFLETAQTKLRDARRKFDDAHAQLTALGPREKLPSLLAGMPERLNELEKRLEIAEKRLSSAWDTTLQTTIGQA